jgi:hypothetical protein
VITFLEYPLHVSTLGQLFRSILRDHSVGFPEIYYLAHYYEALGFPKLPESAWPNCGVIGLHPGCTKKRVSPPTPS